MRNISKVILIVGLILSATNACKRDDHDNIEPLVRDVPCLLTKITIVNNHGDLVQKMDYDKYRRLVKNLNYTLNYSIIDYNKEGKVSKITSYVDERGSWRITYNWDSNSLIMIGETLINKNPPNDVYKVVYNFDTYNQLIKETQYRNLDNKYYYEGYVQYTWENGNISLSEHYNSFDVKFYTESYEYDDKPNAYSSFGYYHDVGIKTLTKNNLIKHVTTNMDGSVTFSELGYEYNDRGYPIKCTYINTDLVTLFEYNCLEQ